MEDKMFELMTKMYSEIQELKQTMPTKDDLFEVKKEIDLVKKDVALIKKDVETTRKDIVHLEHNLLNKIDALFDAREVQIDRETEIVTNLKQVQNKVDKLDLRIVRNNLKQG